MSYFQIDFNIPEGNSPDHHRHASQYVDQPKICLRGDGTPVIFYRGSAPDFTAVANRGYTAVYAQIALSDGAQPGGTMGGGYSFNNQACHVVGLGPDANNTGQGANNVHYYDAIVDEYDRAIVVATLDDQQTSGSPAQTFASRQTYVTTFDTNKTLADQYSTTTGLGTTRVLLKAPVYDGTTETRYLDPRYKDIQITTNGQGEIHIVLGFRLTGGDDNRVGAVYRDASKQEASGIAPQQWATVSHTETNSLYDGGYAEQSTTPDWSGGGSLNSPTTPVNEITHFMHVWLPSIEFDQNPSADDWVIRSMNIRWLSVPSLNYDATTGWQPVGSAQSLAGNEDFVHFAPQLRYQRFWGFNASELDLTWLTNENSWYTTQHEGSRLFMPSTGGVSFAFGGSVGQGIPGYPSGV
jgi:hypothetical protein